MDPPVLTSNALDVKFRGALLVPTQKCGVPSRLGSHGLSNLALIVEDQPAPTVELLKSLSINAVEIALPVALRVTGLPEHIVVLDAVIEALQPALETFL